MITTVNLNEAEKDYYQECEFCERQLVKGRCLIAEGYKIAFLIEKFEGHKYHDVIGIQFL